MTFFKFKQSVIMWRDLNNKEKVFYVYPHSYLFQSTSFLVWIQISTRYHFLSAQRMSFNISYCVDLWIMNSFSFCRSQKICTLPLFLKDISTRYKIPGWDFFPPSLCFKGGAALSSCVVSYNKLAVIIILIPAYVKCICPPICMLLRFSIYWWF